MSRSTSNSKAYEVKTTASQRKANRAMFWYAYEVVLKRNGRLKADREVKRTGKILIAEGNPDHAIITKTILEGKGYECTVATNGIEAVELAGTLIPDLIITSIMLAKLDGLEVITRICGNPKTASIPVLIVSAKYFSPQELISLRGAIDGYLPKPITSTQLLYHVDLLIK